jgi:hypothetical protein
MSRQWRGAGMTSSSPGPARVDLHHHIFPSGKLAEFIQRGLIADSGWRFPGGSTPVLGNAQTLLPRLAVNTAA